MIELRIQEQPIDLPPDVSVALEYNSPLYFGEDVEVIPGTVVFSFTALPTARNAATLRHIDAHDTRLQVRSYDRATLSLRGNVIVEGRVEVTQMVEGYTLKLYAGVGALGALKDVYIDDPALDLRGGFSGRVQINTNKYGANDFFVFPVWNTKTSSYFNEWDFENDQFKDPDTPIVPFVRATYILDKVLDYVGYSYRSRLLQGEQMGGLVLLSNTQINDIADSNIPAWGFVGVLPHVLATDFIKQLARVLVCAIVADNQQRVLRLIRYADLLADTPSVDWTNKILQPITQEWLSPNAVTTADLRAANFIDNPIIITPPDRLIEVEATDWPTDLRMINSETEKLDTCTFIFSRGEQTANSVGGLVTKDYPASGTTNAAGTVNLESLSWTPWLTALSNARLLSAEVALTFNDLDTLDLTRKVEIQDRRTGNTLRGFIKQLKTTINAQEGITSSTVEIVALPS